ncbi:hypothetical protein GCM10010176_010330 [Nonomuraea spiralis]|nr:hypothetical protein GCM10010176_010330 [Nonomuraea spiralis]
MGAAGHAYLAAVAFEDPGDHGDRGGLARAVGAEQAVRLAGGDGEADVVDRDEVSERLSQILTCQDLVLGHRSSVLAGVREIKVNLTISLY